MDLLLERSHRILVRLNGLPDVFKVFIDVGDEDREVEGDFTLFKDG